MGSLVGVVTDVTSAIIGAVVSVVVLSVEVVSLSVVVEEPLSLVLLQEMMVKLKRNMERIMSRCFNWFPFWWIRRTLLIPEFGVFYKNRGFYLEAV